MGRRDRHRHPKPLGVYALEWKTSETTDELLGRFGGVLHGTVVDFQPARCFLVADCYWLPPDGDPIGPMALEVSCGTPERTSGPAEAARSTQLRVTQRGIEEGSPRWVRYYELLASGWPPALEKMKVVPGDGARGVGSEGLRVVGWAILRFGDLAVTLRARFTVAVPESTNRQSTIR